MKFNAPKFQSDPNEIRLKGGESVQGILRGDPYEFEHAFKPGDKPKFRFKINMVLMENKAMVCKILSGGWKLYDQLVQLDKAGWKLDQIFMRVSRQGTTINDTVYSATPVPTPPSPETLATVAKMPLRELTGGDSVAPAAAAQPGDFQEPESDIPF